MKTFVWTAQRYWNGRFWLINNFGEFEFKRGQVSYIPNIRCKFELIAESIHNGPTTSYHHVVDVVRLHSSERSFRSASTLYADQDIRVARTDFDSQRRPIMQAAHVHEVGHLLSLAHVDVGKAHCPATGDTNAFACYGMNDSDKHSVMGAGMWIRKEHALPWRRALVALTGKGNIESATDWPASSIQIFPRTAAEAGTGKLITARPVR